MLTTRLEETKEYKQAVILTAEAYDLTFIDSTWHSESVFARGYEGFWYDVMKEKFRQLLTQEEN